MDLVAGLNIIGLRCVPPGYNAFQMLTDIGTPAEISALQRFDPDGGNFQTAVYAGGVPAGSDFLIRVGEAYLVHMLADRPGFDPLD